MKNTRSKFHDIPFLQYIDSCVAPKRIASVTPDLCSARFMLHCEPEVG